jgi:hypothetical protein
MNNVGAEFDEDVLVDFVLAHGAGSPIPSAIQWARNQWETVACQDYAELASEIAFREWTNGGPVTHRW